MNRFEDIDYLKGGTASQQEVYDLLCQGRYLEQLQHYSVRLTGSFPIAVNIPGSDVDLVCSFSDGAGYVRHLEQSFGQMPEFRMRCTDKFGSEAWIASFKDGNLLLEIFGQALPVGRQLSYRHLLIEDRVLRKYGNEFRAAVISLKRRGASTEEAFCKLLGLPGNPYIALLSLENNAALPPWLPSDTGDRPVHGK
ncbi:DUF4269 domain-containing protein [Pedobacter yulinensis]|uniref:DUF4269 domain-containing protein n=1 Tax=Pedobacter yulinensis TaxID=2126353 RepID=UPI0013A606BB|nr:DUF4269 domain-containing protein [Pedobacter yulinensis]